MMGRAVVVLACLLTLIAPFCAAQDSPIFFIPERTPAPSFTLPDLFGRRVNSTAFSCKVTVLSFDATWCTTCTSELQILEYLHGRFPVALLVYFVPLGGSGATDVNTYMDMH